MYLKYGYIPLEDKVNESFHREEQVSRTLEYAFDDFALSRVAGKYGDRETGENLMDRAMNYRNVYSSSDSCVRGRYADGSFVENFDKYSRQPYITEGTPYQYLWYVPHDIAGLMELMGGEDGFNRNLDQFHRTGQYWHGNEPGHQILFLYNYSGQPWKTQKLVPEYVISGPHFDKITITMGNQKEIVITAPGASSGKNYIHGLTVNGVKTDRNYLSHTQLVNGAILHFTMGQEPNKEWGTGKDSRPFSLD